MGDERERWRKGASEKRGNGKMLGEYYGERDERLRLELR